MFPPQPECAFWEEEGFVAHCSVGYESALPPDHTDFEASAGGGTDKHAMPKGLGDGCLYFSFFASAGGSEVASGGVGGGSTPISQIVS